MNAVFRFIIKLVLGILGAVLVISLLLAAVIFLAVGTVTALITGRRPTPAVVFSRFRHYSPTGNVWPDRRSGESAVPGRSSQSDVVDVQVREIESDRSPR
jgi:hypothetical protein